MEKQARHGEGEEQLDMVLDMKTSHGSAREEREACAREEDEVQAGARPGLIGRHAGAPGHQPGQPDATPGRARRRPDPMPVPTERYTVGRGPPPGCHPAPGPVPTGPAGP